MRILKPILVLALACLPAAAAEPSNVALTTENPAASEGPVSGPVMGYVFDAAHRGLRPILGIPGAAHVGALLQLNVDLVASETSPAGDYALGVDADGVLYRIGLRAGLGSAEAIHSALQGVDRIFLSPSGDAAVVYERSSRQAQLLRDLHTSAEVGGVVELGDLPGVVTALAVADDGRTLLAAASTRQGGAIYTATSGASPTQVAAAGQVVSLAFVPGSTDALAVDGLREETLRITSLGRSPSVTVIAGPADGVRAPVAVAATPDGRSAVIAAARTRSIAVVDFAGGAPRVMACNCEPRRVAPMGASLRLTDDPAQPIYLLGEKADEVFFVPAGADAAEAVRTPRAPARVR